MSDTEELSECVDEDSSPQNSGTKGEGLQATLKRWAAEGIKILPPDDPFYSRGPSIIFRSRPSGDSAFRPPPPPPPLREERPIPPRPVGFDCVFPGWGAKTPRGVPRRIPSSAVSLGWVGWSWCPGSERFDAFTLASNERYWLLYVESKDEWLGDFGKPLVAAYGPRAAAGEFEAAVHLLATVWREDPGSETEGEFHEVHGEGFLSKGEFEAISDLAQLQRGQRD